MSKEQREEVQEIRSNDNERDELQAYEPPKVQSMKLTDEAAEALT